MAAAAIPAAIQAAASIGSAILGRNKGDKRKNRLIDDLLASLKGQGSYNNLFHGDEAAFQKSFVEPAKNIFNNQIAPQIQQSYIANGQQRGSGLEDTLTRAGVNLDDMLNQYYMQFQENSKNRGVNAISSILGGGNPAPQSNSSAAGQGAAGYLSSDKFGSSFSNILEGFNKKKSDNGDEDLEYFNRPAPRKGFEG